MLPHRLWKQWAPLRKPAGLAAAALLLAALSMLGSEALAFDPLAWLIWGEQVAGLHLDTAGGPSWKPLPVALTTPLSFTGAAAPDLWLVVARAGAILGLFAIAALGQRLGGHAVAVAAALIVLVSPWWWHNAALGNSEGILTAAVGWAAVAHLAGHRRLTMIAGLLAATIRPEVCAIYLAYGALLVVRSRSDRRFAVACLVVAVWAWVGPDVLGTGGAFRAASSADDWASPGSAQNADVPVLAVLADAVAGLTLPALVAATFAVVSALRKPGTAVAVGLTAAAVGYVSLVAALTGAGFAGNPRYLVPALALAAPVAAAGAVQLGHRLSGPAWRRVGGCAGAAGLVSLVLAVNASALGDARSDIATRISWSAGLTEAIDAAGGPVRLRSFRQVETSERWRPLVAYRLGIPLVRVQAVPGTGDVVVLGPPQATSRPSGAARLIARAGGWAIWNARTSRRGTRIDRDTRSRVRSHLGHP